jgi:hypothetical protein
MKGADIAESYQNLGVGLYRGEIQVWQCGIGINATVGRDDGMHLRIGKHLVDVISPFSWVSGTKIAFIQCVFSDQDFKTLLFQVVDTPF